ncbi:MAG: DMT family transporter [Rhizobiales bacterium]|nr:DMT family transporter [Hyphomicrobiales bacterium]
MSEAAGAAKQSAAPSKATLGIVFALLAVACFSGMDVLVKWQSATYAVVQVIFFRSILAFVPLGIMSIFNGGWEAVRPNDIWAHIWRSLIGLCAMSSVFAAFSLMKLADVVAIVFAAPVFATALSVPILGEKVGPRRWFAVALGFVGVLIIIRPGTSAFDPTAVLALFGAACIGITTVYVRKLTRTESNGSIIFSFTLTTTVASGVLLPFFWKTPDSLDLTMLCAIGLLGGIAQMFQTGAARHAEVATITPFKYTALLWAMFYGYLIWGEVPDGWTLVGAAIVGGSGLFIVLREAHLKPDRANRIRRWTLWPRG